MKEPTLKFEKDQFFDPCSNSTQLTRCPGRNVNQLQVNCEIQGTRFLPAFSIFLLSPNSLFFLFFFLCKSVNLTTHTHRHRQIYFTSRAVPVLLVVSLKFALSLSLFLLLSQVNKVGEESVKTKFLFLPFSPFFSVHRNIKKETNTHKHT